MFTSLMLGAALAVAAPAPKAEPKKDPASPVGTWAGEKLVAGGMERPAPIGGLEFTLTDDGKLFVREGRKETPDEGSYTIDAKKDPAEIDLVPPADKKDVTMQGIYKVEGDVLTLCLSRGPAGAGARPTKFESPVGSEVMLMTLKRVKKDKEK